jgi:hypothetical protein
MEDVEAAQEEVEAETEEIRIAETEIAEVDAGKFLILYVFSMKMSGFYSRLYLLSF